MRRTPVKASVSWLYCLLYLFFIC